MAWIYLAASEELRSDSVNGSLPLPIVKSNRTLKRYLFKEWPKVNYLKLPSGMTLQHSEDVSYPTSTLFTAASHAKTSVLLDVVKAWGESVVDFSLRCVDWSKKSSPVLSSWKMCQPLELEDFEKSSAHLQIWGMTVAGRAYLPQKLVPRTLEKDGSYWPTPTASSAGTNGKKMCLQTGKWVNGKPSLTTLAIHKWGGKLNPTWVEWLMGYPLEWTDLKHSVTVLCQDK